MSRKTPPHLPLLLLLALMACESEDKSNPTCEQEPCYYENVAPIVVAKCINCHREDGVGPFSMESYEGAKARAKDMKKETGARRMPPWNVTSDGSCNTYANSLELTQAEIDTIAAWADNGAPSGNPSNAPELPEPVPFEVETSLVVSMPEEYTPTTVMPDDYRCFIIDPGFDQTRYLTAYEVIPGNMEIVHHVILFAINSEEAEVEADRLDAAEPGPGYTCFGNTGIETPQVETPPSRFIGLWAPGGSGTRLPEGTGIMLNPGRRFVLQIHYNLAKGPAPDLTKMNLELVDSVEKVGYLAPVADLDMVLAPQLEQVSTARSFLIENTGVAGSSERVIWGVAPHMHLLGKSLQLEIEHPDDSKECLVDMPRWDFSWQRMYWYENAPLRLNVGDRLNLSCSYDTRDRDLPVTWGEGTRDEMCLAFIYVTLE